MKFHALVVSTVALASTFLSGCALSPGEGEPLSRNVPFAVYGLASRKDATVIVKAYNYTTSRFEEVGRTRATGRTYPANSFGASPEGHEWQGSVTLGDRYWSFKRGPDYCKAVTTCSGSVCRTTTPLCAAPVARLRFEEPGATLPTLMTFKQDGTQCMLDAMDRLGDFYLAVDSCASPLRTEVRVSER